MSHHDGPALEAINLSKTFGSLHALKNLCLKVEPGMIYSMLGANGAGKTTTVNLFLNFLEPSGGQAKVLGVNVSTNTSQARSQITYIPEQVALYPDLTGLENLTYFLQLAGHRGPNQPVLRGALEEAGLAPEFHTKRVQGYSKGMRQKVGVAMALVRRSSVLLLDEPMSGLDPASANEFSNILTRLSRQGAAIFMVTHDLYRVKQLSHRVGIMKRGQLVDERETRDLETTELEKLYLEHMRL